MKFLRKYLSPEEHTCPVWVGYLIDNFLRQLFHNPQKILSPYLKEGMTIIDIGCGMGFFSIAAAKIMEEKGCIISVDIQEKMLDIVRKRAEKAGLDSFIRTHLCSEDELGVNENADFALAFWSLHEMKHKKHFFEQVFSILNHGSKLLIVEPVLHVYKHHFDHLIKIAEETGFILRDTPKIRFSFTQLLEKPNVTNAKKRSESI